jgi:hypothetical protein
MSIRRGLLAVVLTAGLVECRPRPPAPEAIRLTDLYRPDTVEGRFAVAATDGVAVRQPCGGLEPGGAGLGGGGWDRRPRRS